MLDRAGYEFSFPGLKTAVSLAVRARPLDEQRRADIARGLQDAIVDTLCVKALRALEATGLKQLVVAGGVDANLELRERLRRDVAARGGAGVFPRPGTCTANPAGSSGGGVLARGAGRACGRRATRRAR